MKFKYILILLNVTFLSGCATIVGGSKYYAKIHIEGHPNASIYVKDRFEGKGSASVLVSRKDADKFSFTIKEENCEDQTFKYRKRVLRGWAVIGSVVTYTFTNVEGEYLIPIGVIVDVMNGAIWKPDISEKDITKLDYKHYSYAVEYTGCKTTEKQVVKPAPVPSPINEAKEKAEKLREKKKLLDEGILTQEEYNKEKAKILEEK